MTLSQQEKEALLRIARNALDGYLNHKKITKTPEKDLSEEVLAMHCGVFVSIYVDNQLRGCIGRFESAAPLYVLLAEMTRAAASNDYRFTPLTAEELPQTSIEISVLSPLREIKSEHEIEIGKHGIFMIKDGRRGTLLPKVATEMGWNKVEFLGHCAKDKANIGWTGWKEATLYTYEVDSFSAKWPDT